MADLRDFLQSMSNSAASNVSAPVDGINWLLGKAGLPVSSAPFMGSDWMAQKGLTRPVQQGAASILGETAGMVAPMAIAAKAPQIARGLLQAGENAMIPRTLNPQTGAIVWHGSPHKFDKFDASKIGTGEGAQAYGHGLYLAESPDVAGQYQKTLSADGFLVGDKVFDPAKEITHKNVKYWAQKGDLEGALMTAEKIAASDSPVADIAKRDLVRLREIEAAGGISRNPGALYKVNLPDEHIARMLDWDKPLSQQSKEVQAAFQSPEVQSMVQSLKQKGVMGDYSADELAKFKGEDWHDFIRQASSDSNVAPSEFLKQRGVPGIRYLDGGSRGTGAGTSNFVVFPGNEDILKIMERNGKGLLAD